MARKYIENNAHINENIINQKQRDGTDRINFNHLKTAMNNSGVAAVVVVVAAAADTFFVRIFHGRPYRIEDAVFENLSTSSTSTQ